ncbi:CobW family GTP-binding protein [Clostridium sp. AM58-1XD]|uniref:CobW family GTP-binding protein n=1 Tax=Clostridium sp. AM58-1XD TaxID=2292307 RepID=UPI000E53299B|nr:CobW family GTP-binding protein [Clostridium sp. AM58-1XD]RGY96349.1 cobalamin biosynthesis protein CobW [Clostridium sp. AM58-1XD]
MTKIDIISGFLGAGKTTFIKKLIQEAIAGEQVVLIENEFGEIGIDGGFLKDSGIEIREMNSGCICCSLVGDFGKSLKEVLIKYRPDRVIIEPSGVGKLSDVMKAVRDVAADLEVELNSAVTIVDAAKCKMYMKNFGEFFNNQIEHAGTIVLSRTDVVPAEKVQAAVELLRGHNERCTIVTTPAAELSGSQLLEIIEKPDNMEDELMQEALEAYKEHHHHDHDHDHEHGEHCSCGCEDHEHGHDHAHEECGCHEEHDHAHGHDHAHEECGCHEEHDHAHHHDHDHEHEHGEHCSCGCHDHDHDHHHADEVFTSWGIEHVGACKKEDLEAVLEELAYGASYGDVLRAKGMVPGENQGEWYYFDLVPEEYEIRTGRPEYTGKVCVIGANLNEDELKKAFGRG